MFNLNETMSSSNSSDPPLLTQASLRQPHHEKDLVCLNRPRYRDGRKKTCVKVYSIANESAFLLLKGVSTLPGSLSDLVRKMEAFGKLLEHRILSDYPILPSEAFTMAVLFKYSSVFAARAAKRRMDDKSHMGVVLHCTYAPEFEDVEECRMKLMRRRSEVLQRLQWLANPPAAKEKVWEEFQKGDFSVRNAILRDNALRLGEPQGPSTNKKGEEEEEEKQRQQQQQQCISINDDVHAKLSRFVKERFK